MPMILPASTSCLVSLMSSSEGVGSPEGIKVSCGGIPLCFGWVYNRCTP